MTDSMKFGPEWLRNMSNDSNTTGASSTSSSSVTSLGPRYQLGEYRYGREEMLSLFDKNIKLPDILPTFKKLFVDKVQCPLALTPSTEEETGNTTRPWIMRSPVNYGTTPTRAISRGGSVDRGRGRTRGGFHTSLGYQRPAGLYEDEIRGTGRGERSWPERNGGNEIGTGDWNNSPSSSPRKEYGSHGRGSNIENWRRNRTEEEVGEGWRSGHRWSRSTSWRDEDSSENGKADGGGCVPSISRSISMVKFSSLHERASSVLPSNLKGNSHNSSKGNSQWDQDDMLPEWAMENPTDIGGSFDASGAFHEPNERNDSKSPSSCSSSNKNVSQSDGGKNHEKHYIDDGNDPDDENVNDEQSKNRISPEPPEEKKDTRTENENFAESSIEQLTKPPETKSELNRNEEVRLSKEGELPGDEPTDNNIRTKSNESSENESKEPEVLDPLPKDASQQQRQEEQLQGKVSNHNQTPPQTVPQDKSLPPMESVGPIHSGHSVPMQQQIQKSVPPQLHQHPPQMPPHANPTLPKLVQPIPNLSPAPEPATDHMKEFADHMIEKLIMDDETSTMSGKSANQVPKKNNLGVAVNSPTTSANMIPQPQTDAHAGPQTPHSSRAQDFWYYRDPQGNVQGPFPAAEMAEWYRLEYFDDNLFVRRACDSRYATLGELVDMCGSNMPFLSSHLIPPLVETPTFPAVSPVPHVTQPAQPTQHPPPPVNKQSNVNMVMGANDAFASLNLQLQYLQKQYLLRQQTAIMTRLAASEPWSLLTPDQQQQMVNQKMTQVVLPDHLLSLSAFANYLSIVNPTYNVQQVAAAKNFYNPMKSPQPPMGNSIGAFRNAHSEFSTTELHNLMAAASQVQAANPNLPSHMSPSVENEAIKALLMQLQMHKGIQPNMSPPTQAINQAKWSNIVQQHQQLQQQQQQQQSQPPMQQKPPQQQDKQKEQQQMQHQKDIKQQEHHHNQQQPQMTAHQSQHGMSIRYHRHHQPGRLEKQPPSSDQHLTHQEQPQHMQQQPAPARLSSTNISPPPPSASPPPSPKPPTPPNLKQFRHVQEQQQQKQHQRQQELLQQQKQTTKQKQELQQSIQNQIQNQSQQKQLKQRQHQIQVKLPEQQEQKQQQLSKQEQSKQGRQLQQRQQSSQQQKHDASEKSEYEQDQSYKQESLKQQQQQKLDQLDQSKEHQKLLKQDHEQKSKTQEQPKVKQVQLQEEHRKQKEEKRRLQASPQVQQQQNEQQKEKTQAQKVENDQQKRQLEEKKAQDQQKEREQQLKEQQRKQQEEVELKLAQQQQDEQLREQKLHERFQEDQELLNEREKHEQHLRLQKQQKQDLEEEQRKQRQQQFFMLLLQGNTELTQHMKVPGQEQHLHQKNEAQQQQEQQRLQQQLEHQFEQQQRELERFDQHDHYQLQQQQLQQPQKQQSKSTNDEKLKSNKFEDDSKKPSSKGNKTEKKESAQQKKHTTTNDDEKKKDPTDERKRQKEEKRRQQMEEEKKRDEEERRKQEEQHRLQMEEKKRQEEIDQHRRMKLLENNGIRAAKLNFENGRVGASVAPWSNTGVGGVAAPGPNFAEIQKAERERRAEEQRLEQLMEHQRKNQQLEMQVQKESTLKWNAQPLQPLTVKSLSEIQAEEHKRQLANEQAAALTADQTRRKDPVATMQTIAYPNNSINSIWNNRTNQSSAWNGKAWSTTSSSGFWEEPTKITFNNSNKPQAPVPRSLSKSQTISNMQTVKSYNAINKNQFTAPQQAQPSQSHLPPSTATMYAGGDNIRINKVNYSDVYQTKSNSIDATGLSNSNNTNSNNDSKKDDDARSEFTSWCIKALSSMHSTVDVPTFISFLQDIESPYEVKDYIRMYLGETKDCNEFAKQFLERRSKYKNQQRAQNAHIDDMCSPAPAINPSSNDFQEVKGKGKKIKKSKMTKLDARILGFSVTAAQDRLNVGDRDYGDAS